MSSLRFKAVNALGAGHAEHARVKAYAKAHPRCQMCGVTKTAVVLNDARFERRTALCGACAATMNPRPSPLAAKMASLRKYRSK